MTEEIANRIKALSETLQERKGQISELEYELHSLYLEGAGNFVGSFLEYNNCYMKVEKQYENGGLLIVKGPVLSLDVDPLDDENDEVGLALFRSEDEFYLTLETLRGVGPIMLNKLSKEEMEQVLARFHVSLGNFFGV